VSLLEIEDNTTEHQFSHQDNVVQSNSRVPYERLQVSVKGLLPLASGQSDRSASLPTTSPTSMALSRLDQKMERETVETFAKNELHALLSKMEDWVSQDTMPKHQTELQANIDFIDNVSDFQKTLSGIIVPRYLQVLLRVNPATALYSHLLRQFRSLCQKSLLLPASCYLKDESNIILNNQSPAYGGFSDVSQGTYGKTVIALKRLRLHVDNKVRAEKASLESSQNTH
jgi:hypothetical protein